MSCSWVILLVSWCCTLHTAVGCSLSPRVYFILFVSLRGLRSYLITYVNFKVLYIARENYLIFTCFVAAFCELCSIQNGMGRYELIQMVDIEWHVFQWTKIVQTFYGKGPHPLLWAGTRFARGKSNKLCASPAKLLWIMPAVWRPLP
jgi:hypothetical protein